MSAQTITKLLRHAEDMQLVRKDFKKFWDSQVEPLMQKTPLTREQSILFELGAWRCFLEGRKQRK